MPALRPTADDLVPAFPLAVFVGGGALAWRFKRRRLLVMLLVLAVPERALTYWEPDAFGRFLEGALALLLPLDLALLAWLPERGRLGRRFVAVLLVLAAQALALAVLAMPPLAPVRDQLALALLLGSLPAFGVAVLATLGRFALSPTPAEAGSVWAVLATVLAAGVARDALDATIYLATAGLVLVVSLVETSHAMAYGDELTGLPGRTALTEALGELGDTYTVAMVDIDHFKKFNDEHGHQVGDQLLRLIGGTLAGVGGGGRAFRYGGEEFAVLFPDRAVVEVLPHLETLRRRIAEAPFTIRAPGRPRRKPTPVPPDERPRRRVSVTVSIGAAEGTEDDPPERVVKAADAALYRAKRGGRNRVCH
jgi:diguanylate cyclase (GGDEF)-like protein